MKVFVLGATGTTGGLFVDDALDEGHEVVAYVRSSGKLAPRERLAVVVGDVENVDMLARAMRDADAVVSMLGLSSAKPNGFSEKAVRVITAAAERSGVARVLVMSAFGVGDSLPKASGLAQLMYSGGGKAIFADKAAGEKVLKASSLEWTLAYPVLLTNKAKSPAFQALDLAAIDRLPGVPRVARADVARFLLDAAGSGDWARRTAVLTTGK
ncbi:NAD(P)-dependent oxidoreductase [Arthrobacter sp. HY1533]|uniref:NAD(P)-dependent oxidoreductase n=1 Tax=Arthrobacter sp. HY1533 TaxID=2970919 RepID=UPI0022B9F365|nr:NAD(P)-binding oxidoreductase [Arthrobacter sp. HY1533]